MFHGDAFGVYKAQSCNLATDSVNWVVFLPQTRSEFTFTDPELKETIVIEHHTHSQRMRYCVVTNCPVSQGLIQVITILSSITNFHAIVI